MTVTFFSFLCLFITCLSGNTFAADAPVMSGPYQLQVREDVSFAPEALNFVDTVLFEDGDPIIRLLDSNGEAGDYMVDDLVVAPRGDLTDAECNAATASSNELIDEETKKEICSKASKLLLADVKNDEDKVMVSSEELAPYLKGFPITDIRISDATIVYRNGDPKGIAVAKYLPLISQSNTPLSFAIGFFAFEDVDGKKVINKASGNLGWKQIDTKCNKPENPEQMVKIGCFGDYWPVAIVSADIDENGISDLVVAHRGHLPDNEHAFVTYYKGKDPDANVKELKFSDLFTYETIAPIGKEPTSAAVALNGKTVYVATEDGINIIEWQNNKLVVSAINPSKPEGMDLAMRPYQTAVIDAGGGMEQTALTWAKLDAAAQTITFANKFTVFGAKKDAAGVPTLMIEHFDVPVVTTASTESDTLAANPVQLAATAFSPEINEVGKYSPPLLWVGEQNVHKEGSANVVYAHAFPIVNGVPDPLSATTWRVNGEYSDKGVKLIKIDRHGNAAFVMGEPKVNADIFVPPPAQIEDYCPTVDGIQPEAIAGHGAFTGKDAFGHNCYTNDTDCDGISDYMGYSAGQFINKTKCDLCPGDLLHCTGPEGSGGAAPGGGEKPCYNPKQTNVCPPPTGGEHGPKPPSDECAPLQDEIKIKAIYLPDSCKTAGGGGKCYMNDMDCDGITDPLQNLCKMQWNQFYKDENTFADPNDDDFKKCNFNNPYEINQFAGAENSVKYPCIDIIVNCCSGKSPIIEDCIPAQTTPPPGSSIIYIPGPSVPNIQYFPPSVDACAQKGSDKDADGICDDVDNCAPKQGQKCYGSEMTQQIQDKCYNPSQQDLDQDGIGDACDPCVCKFCSIAPKPTDPDVITGYNLSKGARASSTWIPLYGKEINPVDAGSPFTCQENELVNTVCNKTSTCFCIDPDGDRICSPDLGGDLIASKNSSYKFDNCPFVQNYSQDSNKCKNDIDGDKFLDSDDKCDFVFSTGNEDGDNDDVGFVCDTCPGFVGGEDECKGKCKADDDESTPYKGVDTDGDGTDDACDQLTFPVQYNPNNYNQSSLRLDSFSLIAEANAASAGFFKEIFGGGEVKDKGAVTVLINKGVTVPAIPETRDCFVDIGREAGKSSAADAKGGPIDNFITSHNDKIRAMFQDGFKYKSGKVVPLKDIHTDLWVGENGGFYRTTCAIQSPELNIDLSASWRAVHQLGGMPLNLGNYGKMAGGYRPGLPAMEMDIDGKKVTREQLLKGSATRLLPPKGIESIGTKGLFPDIDIAAVDFPLPDIITSLPVHDISLPDSAAISMNVTNFGLPAESISLGSKNPKDALINLIVTPISEQAKIKDNLEQLSINEDIAKWPGAGTIYELRGISGLDLCGWGHPDICAPPTHKRNLDMQAVEDSIQSCINQIVDDPQKDLTYINVMACMMADLKAKGKEWDNTGWLRTAYVISEKANVAASVSKDIVAKDVAEGPGAIVQDAATESVTFPILTVPINFASQGGWNCGLVR